MKNNKILTIILVVIIILIVVVSVFIFTNNNSSNNGSVLSSFSADSILGSQDYGSVERLGPFGNESSNIKIAYVVGLHPLENKAHSAFLNEFYGEENDLRYCYYIYQINVTQNAEDYNQGRMNGQLLAQEFVVDDAINQNYSFVVDVHSNEGNWDENQFIFSPNQNDVSKEYGERIVNDLDFSTYFVPPNPTSTDYLTLPLINGGIPAIIYEEYVQNSRDLMEDHMDDLIEAVDELSF